MQSLPGWLLVCIFLVFLIWYHTEDEPNLGGSNDAVTLKKKNENMKKRNNRAVRGLGRGEANSESSLRHQAAPSPGAGSSTGSSAPPAPAQGQQLAAQAPRNTASTKALKES